MNFAIRRSFPFVYTAKAQIHIIIYHYYYSGSVWKGRCEGVGKMKTNKIQKDKLKFIMENYFTSWIF